MLAAVVSMDGAAAWTVGGVLDTLPNATTQLAQTRRAIRTICCPNSSRDVCVRRCCAKELCFILVSAFHFEASMT